MRALLITTILLLGGCIGGPPKERETTLEQRQLENSTSAIATDVTRETKTTQPEVKLSQTNRDGSRTEVIVPAASETKTSATVEAGERGSFNASGSYSWIESIPLYVKVIGLAIGIGLFVLVIGVPIYVLYKHSVAARATIDTLDHGIGAAIHRVKDFAAANKDDAQAITLKTIEAELINLRRERGKS